jgi:hypothetical protein
MEKDPFVEGRKQTYLDYKNALCSLNEKQISDLAKLALQIRRLAIKQETFPGRTNIPRDSIKMKGKTKDELNFLLKKLAMLGEIYDPYLRYRQKDKGKYIKVP